MFPCLLRFPFVRVGRVLQEVAQSCFPIFNSGKKKRDMLVQNDSSQSFRQQRFPRRGSCSSNTHSPRRQGKRFPCCGRGDSHRSLHPALVVLLRLAAAAAAPLHAPVRHRQQQQRARHRHRRPLRAAPRPLLWPRGRAGPGAAPSRTARPSQPGELGSLLQHVCFFPFILFFLAPPVLGNLTACHTAKGLAVLSVSQKHTLLFWRVFFKVQIFERYVKKEGLSHISSKI